MYFLSVTKIIETIARNLRLVPQLLLQSRCLAPLDPGWREMHPADVKRARTVLRVSGARLRCNRISTDAPETGPNCPVFFFLCSMQR